MINRDPDITRLRDWLERRGLIHRGREQKDRRVIKARISAVGLNLLKGLNREVAEFHRQLLGHLGEAQLQSPQNLNVVSGLSSTTLNVTGSKHFKIDDPLDPTHKYLYHSVVESPEMMNVYNGSVTTDKHGMAVVTLPNYFDALNRDFRYQLTAIGTFAQATVAKKIEKNRFAIRTSKPQVEVSWQVTGIRQDAYANAHRMQVEEEKPLREQGRYLHPELFETNGKEVIAKDAVSK